MTREEAYEKFKSEVCSYPRTVDPGDEVDWFDLSVGYFLALDFPIDEVYEMAREVRYKLNYWWG